MVLNALHALAQDEARHLASLPAFVGDGHTALNTPPGTAAAAAVLATHTAAALVLAVLAMHCEVAAITLGRQGCLVWRCSDGCILHQAALDGAMLWRERLWGPGEQT
jgi:hypothetical protein